MRVATLLFFAVMTFLVGRAVLVLDVLAPSTPRMIEALITYVGALAFVIWAGVVWVLDQYERKVREIDQAGSRSRDNPS